MGQSRQKANDINMVYIMFLIRHHSMSDSIDIVEIAEGGGEGAGRRGLYSYIPSSLTRHNFRKSFPGRVVRPDFRSGLFGDLKGD
jgi:hypothetical protein